MDFSVLLFIFFSSCVFLVFLKSCHSYKRFGSAKLPPGPKPLPIFGNIFQLGEKPHQSLTALSKTYGPLMSLKLGSVATIVISSSDMAREIFRNNNLALSSRTFSDVVRACNHHEHSMAWLPASTLWRNSRKIMSIQIFSTYRLNKTRFHREQKVADLLEYVRSCSSKCQPVNIGHAAFTTVLNLLSNTFFSFDMADYSDDLSQEFKQLVWDVMRIIGKPNFSDYFPILRHLDPQGARRQATFCFNRVFAVFDRIVKQRLIDPPSSNSPNNDHDVLDSLLEMSKESGSQVNLEYIRHLLFDLFVAGTDTTSSTLEWAMTELLRHPTVLEKAQAEIDEVLGKELELVQESDISKLPYLEAIIKETFRLYPAAPLSVPRKAETDVNMYGYSVPKGTQVLLNLWAIGRDPEVWGPNSELFCPERFLGCGIDINRGLDHFELMPFGVGRRICPGLPLAHRMLHLMLANLIHSFNWKLPDGMQPEQVDMTDKFGLTLQKLKPLQAVPISK